MPINVTVAGNAGSVTFGAQQVDAADGHVAMRLVASPSNTTLIHVSANSLETAFTGTHLATDGEPVGPGGLWAADVGTASPMYAASTASAWVYYTGLVAS